MTSKDNKYQALLKKFRDASYDAGYYAGRLMDKTLSDTERAETMELSSDAILKRANLQYAMLRIVALNYIPHRGYVE